MQRTITLIIGLIISGSIVGFIAINAMLQGEVRNFQQCKDRGYPVQETDPETCVTPDEKRFTNTNQKLETSPI